MSANKGDRIETDYEAYLREGYTRASRHHSAAAIAREIGVHKSTLYRYERGETISPSNQALLEIYLRKNKYLTVMDTPPMQAVEASQQQTLELVMAGQFRAIADVLESPHLPSSYKMEEVRNFILSTAKAYEQVLRERGVIKDPPK